eukprot:m.44405 g.44405  ORF g.44405 m.44405 type:complete len:84 (+) comp12110_c0_seq2:636-887(+)
MMSFAPQDTSDSCTFVLGRSGTDTTTTASQRQERLSRNETKQETTFLRAHAMAILKSNHMIYVQVIGQRGCMTNLWRSRHCGR